MCVNVCGGWLCGFLYACTCMRVFVVKHKRNARKIVVHVRPFLSVMDG